MSITFSVVPCCEEHVTQEEQWGEGEITCSVVLRCTWDNRHLLVADLIGNAKEWPYGSFSYPPRCKTAAIRPAATTYEEDGQGIDYQDALVTANYSTNVDENEEEDLMSESLEPTTEFLTLDHKRFRWGSETGDPVQEGEAPGKLVKGLNLVRKLFKVTAIPASVLTLPGSVNNAPYTSSILGLTFPAETLLFSPPTLERTITTGGVRAWNVTLKFSYKVGGWNQFWRAATGSVDRMYLVGIGQYNSYPLADFSTFLS